MKLPWKSLLIVPLVLATPAFADSELHGWAKLKNQPEQVKQMFLQSERKVELRPLKEIQAKAAKGEAAAQYALSVRLLKGVDTRPDVPAALQWLQKSAAQNFSPALAALGKIYAAGDVVPEDEKKAIAYYERATKLGNAAAEYQLAEFYFGDKEAGGLGDFKKGLELAQHAAEHGSHSAASFLGDLYFIGGKHNQRNWPEAMNWFMLLATIDDGYSCERIAEIYYRGRYGAKKDLPKAIEYFARSQSTPEAKKWRERMASKRPLTPDELSQAKAWMVAANRHEMKEMGQPWELLHQPVGEVR